MEDKKRVHVMIARTIRSPSFIIDSRASRHMVLTREAFSSLDDSNGPNILLGDKSKNKRKGKVEYILTMVPSIMFCMPQVLLLISCQYIR